MKRVDIGLEFILGDKHENFEPNFDPCHLILYLYDNFDPCNYEACKIYSYKFKIYFCRDTILILPV